MGLNDLLFHHQLSLMRADSAACADTRRGHRDTASGYARRIEDAVGPGRGHRTPLVPLS